MEKSKIVIPFFCISFISGLLSGFFKYAHIGGNKILFTIAMISFIIYVIPSLKEIYTSKKNNISEKLMWTIGFLLINNITGLLYVFIGRRRIF